jgi:hypothetical protein
MFDWYKYDKLRKIDGTNAKLLIGLGDSFTQGQGACSLEIYEKYNWDLNVSTPESEKELWNSFYENSWVNQLTKHYLTDYVSINMGMTGRGNRGAAKELYLHPELELHKYKEKIVVFMLSGLERFDFVHKNFNEHVHYITMWPNVNKDKHEWSDLWDLYLEHIWNDRFGVIELLLTIAEVETWCKANNAKLLITSAFRPDYRKDVFNQMIKGDKNDPKNYLYGNDFYITRLLEIINWNNMIKPNGFNCITDFLCYLEGRTDLINENHSHEFWNYVSKIDKISSKGYITKCGHPSEMAHKEIAKVLYEEIIKRNKTI